MRVNAAGGSPLIKEFRKFWIVAQQGFDPSDTLKHLQNLQQNISRISTELAGMERTVTQVYTTTRDKELSQSGFEKQDGVWNPSGTPTPSPTQAKPQPSKPKNYDLGNLPSQVDPYGQTRVAGRK